MVPCARATGLCWTRRRPFDSVPQKTRLLEWRRFFLFLRRFAMPAERRRFWSLPLAAPRFVAAWLAYVAMRALVLLPFEWQLEIGRRLGRIAWRMMGRRRRIAERNIELCMPELSPAERAAPDRKSTRLNSSHVKIS